MEGHANGNLIRAHEQRMEGLEQRASEDRTTEGRALERLELKVDALTTCLDDLTSQVTRLADHQESDWSLVRTRQSMAATNGAASKLGAFGFLAQPWWWAIIAAVGGPDLLEKVLGLFK